MGQTLRPVLRLLLLSAAVPVLAQQSCPNVTVVKSKSIFDQVVAFLADQKVSIAGQLVGFIADLRESPKLAAIGDGIGLAHEVADYIQKHTGTAPTNIELCPAPPGFRTPFGDPPFSILGTRSDLQKLTGNGWNSSINELLKPYESTSPAIPNLQFHRLINQLGSNSGNTPAVGQSGQNPPQGNRIQFPPWLNAVAAPTQATVTGVVLDEHGNPVSGAVVSLVASFITTAQPQWRMTFENGFYSFTDAPGLYSISARLSSSIQGGEMRSDSQLVSLSNGNDSKVNLYLHPLARTPISQQISPEQKSMIIDFIAAADRSETRAAFDGDSSYLKRFYAGPALAKARVNFDDERRSARVPRLESGQVRELRYEPANFSIEVDTVEVWSEIFYDPKTGRQISTQTGRETPQTITIRQSRDGWYITEVQFHH
ncbi:MAG TPA: carboxypeptidase-like regulatory domain-containing protein [Bryobacteraceae bacterium]|nr:carboxypeptidase-like regulatory domain-containing protein [Bryobacteraceae bacterium]